MQWEGVGGQVGWMAHRWMAGGGVRHTGGGQRNKVDRQRDSSAETIRDGQMVSRQQGLGRPVLTYDGPQNLQLGGLEAGREGGR